MGRSSRHGRCGGALLVACVVAAELLSGSAWAAASEPPAGIHLSYEAAPGCPTRKELLEELGRRVDPGWRSGFDRRRFVVRIERAADRGFAGRLEVTRDGRAPETRELRAETCRAVSAALVVFIAIALDPASDPQPEPAPETPPSPPPPPAPSVPPARPPAPEQRGDRPSFVPRRREPAWKWSSGVTLAYLHAPNAAWGARVEGELARRIADLPIAPALRLSWGFAGFDTRLSTGGEASFAFETGRAHGCARVTLAGTPFTFAPCIGLEIGTLTATSRNIPQVGHTSTPWSAMSGAVRGSWFVLPWLSLDAEIGGLVPFTRTTFGLTEPIRIVYRAPSILFSGSVGLAASARFL